MTGPEAASAHPAAVGRLAGWLVDAATFPVVFAAGLVVTMLALVLVVGMPETLPGGRAVV